ncbi:unnamed protein product [Prorocentrum cordatum]|uniref:3-hydroxyisobutyryl-CoA hydrolase n=1 Tax=Prorocentrum cordatum TaxID=2364126 RepID=A0ABN9TAB3_9DINO|nr:unnamed protein product [Polarella glacialis]
MDDPALRAPVLERSNVGMGMLVLNRPKGLDLPTINQLYTRLRNLEVNSLKRFVGLAAAEPGPFCVGLDPAELLLASTSAMRRGRLPRFSRALLWHSQELAHLVADFRKPLVCHISGLASDGGAALGCLASHSGAHADAEVSVDACFAGLVPSGGMTHVLARLLWSLGEFLALTGWPVRGADLVYGGLVRHWQSPEALPFLELTAEKQLEVSEADARALLDEHSLPLPEGISEADAMALQDEHSLPLPEGMDSVQQALAYRAFSLRPPWDQSPLLRETLLCSGVLPLVHRAFSKGGVNEILQELKKMRSDSSALARDFAKECLDRMSRASPLALHATLHLIRTARQKLQQEVVAPGAAVLGARGVEGSLTAALRLELRAQQRLLNTEDAARGLHARCLGREVRAGEWSRPSIDSVIREDVEHIVDREPVASEGETADFAVMPRAEFSLSTHPRLRRYHPDYNEETGLDHDPQWMAAEQRRWSPDLFAEERLAAMRELLGREDPARCGLSRWTRVEGPAP